MTNINSVSISPPKKRLNISGLPRINIKPIEQTIKPIDFGIVQKKSFLTYTFIYLKNCIKILKKLQLIIKSN